MRIKKVFQILFFVITLSFAQKGYATVIEFNSDREIQIHDAKDYLSSNRKNKFKNQNHRKEKQNLSKLISYKSKLYGINENLIIALIKAESNFEIYAVSHKGAMGLMQLMPDTATRFGVTNPFDPADNIEGGIKYLRFLLQRYNGDIEMSLAAYNAGEGNVSKFGGIPPFGETNNYIKKVKTYFLN